MIRFAACIVLRDEKDVSNFSECRASLEGLNLDFYAMEFTNKFNFKDVKKIEVESKDDMSLNKNKFIKKLDCEWFLFIEPYERLINGKDIIKEIISSNEGVYKFLSIDNGVITKTIRLFHKKSNCFFENPIYESVFSREAKDTNILISSENKNIENEYEKIKKWKQEDKFSSYPIYYESCFYLKNENYDEFIKTSEKYFFMEKNHDLPSYTMLKYYQAFVFFYKKNDIKKSFQNLMFCIEKNPTMAEFWCLLGDINFELRKYKKAYYYYEIGRAHV